MSMTVVKGLQSEIFVPITPKSVWAPVTKPLSEMTVALATAAGVHRVDQERFNLAGDFTWRKIPNESTEEELMDYFAIGQCTPGVIAVNTATFIGQKLRGIWGGIFATLGVVFPSVVIISLLAGVIEAFSHLAWVQHAFGGIRVCVCVLILNAVIKLLKKAVIDLPTLLIFAVVALGSYFLPISPVVFVVLAAVTGIALKSMEGRKAA